MTTSPTTRSAEIRATLDHPIIDTDAHMIELTPVLVDYIRKVGGDAAADAYYKAPQIAGFSHTQGLKSPASVREDRWNTRSGWWGRRTRRPDGSDAALDLATVQLPRLLNDRMDDFGVDYMLVYPSEGLTSVTIRNPEVRRAAVRGYNTYAAELFAPFSSRMTPVAVVPMTTPEEAIDELEHAVNILGHKAVCLEGFVRRPIPVVDQENPELNRYAYRLDFFGLDSDYDYDPVWAKCQELKVAATFHSTAMAWPRFGSISNYVYNHIGGLALCNQNLAKALFLGGVTRRFPDLRFAFLEGGVTWGATLFADLVGHWEKRNVEAMFAYLNPDNLDRELLHQMVVEHGSPEVVALKDELGTFFNASGNPFPPEPDDFKGLEAERREELRDLFVPSFFFGCEADDPGVAMAFNRRANPFGAALNAVIGSDIGHWDLVDPNEIVEEAHELVESGAITPEEFRDFTFVNPVRLHAGANPDFFKGTRVEAAVDTLLRE
jgi:predicted TIM-barrel fold metal-dependent hydrolase